MSNKKLESKKGFTLIELLIAMSIISLIALAFFNVVNTSIKFNAKNEKDIKALQIAQSEIENLRSQIKSGKTSDFKTLDDNNISLNTSTRYQKAIDNNRNTYSVDLTLSKEGPLYTIQIKVISNQSSFSKRSVDLVTQVYGK